jgi:hypothetical protein
VRPDDRSHSPGVAGVPTRSLEGSRAVLDAGLTAREVSPATIPAGSSLSGPAGPKSRYRTPGSTGFVRWATKPTSRDRLRPSSSGSPVKAISPAPAVTGFRRSSRTTSQPSRAGSPMSQMTASGGGSCWRPGWLSDLPSDADSRRSSAPPRLAPDGWRHGRTRTAGPDQPPARPACWWSSRPAFSMPDSRWPAKQERLSSMNGQDSASAADVAGDAGRRPETKRWTTS